MTVNLWYLVLIVPAFIALYAQSRVRRLYDAYGERPNSQGLTGAEVAERLLAHLGLATVRVVETPGTLDDAFDPESGTLRLSERVAHTQSITALGIAAHEVAHAQQHAAGHRYMRAHTWLARRLAPVAGWGSMALFVGLMLRSILLIVAGGVILAGVLVYSVVALALERDASRRALRSLQETSLATPEDLAGVRSVLRSAALTYVTGTGQRAGRLVFYAATAAVLLGLTG